jgi:uncharacterized protein YfaT (DUF1175 family)
MSAKLAVFPNGSHRTSRRILDEMARVRLNSTLSAEQAQTFRRLLVRVASSLLNEFPAPPEHRSDTDS